MDISNDPKFFAADAQMHKLWTWATGLVGYNKKEWQKLEQMIFELAKLKAVVGFFEIGVPKGLEARLVYCTHNPLILDNARVNGGRSIEWCSDCGAVRGVLDPMDQWRMPGKVSY
jgi:hypothetical protein